MWNLCTVFNRYCGILSRSFDQNQHTLMLVILPANSLWYTHHWKVLHPRLPFSLGSLLLVAGNCGVTKAWFCSLHVEQLWRATLVLELSVESVEVSMTTASWISFVLCSTLPLSFSSDVAPESRPQWAFFVQLFISEGDPGNPVEDSWYHRCDRNQNWKGIFKWDHLLINWQWEHYHHSRWNFRSP